MRDGGTLSVFYIYIKKLGIFFTSIMRESSIILERILLD